MRTFRFRIFPTHSQSKKIENVLGLCRYLYNSALEERKSSYAKLGKSTTYKQQSAYLPQIKADLPEYNSVHSQVLQTTLKRLDNAFDGFFRRVKLGEKPGYPRFKNSKHFKSFLYKQSGFRIDGNRLFLSKIGHVKIKQHRAIIGEIKTCSIVRTATGKYFACITAEADELLAKQVIHPEQEIGIDLGIKQYITTSNNECFENPKILKTYQKKLAKGQAKRDSKSGKARKNASKHVARVYEKIANCRADHQHKLSRKLVNRFANIYVEKLDINSMTKDGHRVLNRSIMDAGWNAFANMMLYKAEEAGTSVIFVDPAGTSQECSGCKATVPKELSERLHVCDRCGLMMDRDHNAAINILFRGRFVLGKRIGTDSLHDARSPCL